MILIVCTRFKIVQNRCLIELFSKKNRKPNQPFWSQAAVKQFYFYYRFHQESENNREVIIYVGKDASFFEKTKKKMILKWESFGPIFFFARK